MTLIELVKESALELKERPTMFLPKIITSLISSIWMILLLHSAETMNFQYMYLGLFLFIPVFFLGVWSPVIVAEMIKKNSSLLNSVKSTFSYLPKLVAVSIMLLVGMTTSLLPFYLGAGLHILTGSFVGLIIGSLISLMAVITFVYGIYFLPIALTENETVKSFKKSFKASGTNKKEVTILLLFSFTVLGIAAASSGVLRGLGIAGFIIGRAFSSIVSTYTVIISPKYYLQNEK